MNTEQWTLLCTLIALFQGLSIIWIKAVIQNAVKHKWDLELEKFKFEIRQREQAAMIAEIFSEWDGGHDRRRLNQLVLEANLWLPENLARDLNRILSYHPESKDAKQLIIDVRRLLRGEQDKLQADEIVYFPRQSANEN